MVRYVTALLFTSVLAIAQSDTASPLAKYAWLEGTWRMNAGPMQIEERWTPPAGNVMTGMGRTLKNGSTVFFEYFRIESRKDGIYYVAQPKGVPPTDFKLVRASDTQLVFENPAHDFPKRITYTREANGGVTAKIEGTPEQKKMEEEFRYEPVKCRSAGH
jgi:hypothetical protein